MTVIDRPLDLVSEDAAEIDRLDELIATQKRAFRAAPNPSLGERTELLNTVVATVLAHRREMKDALIADFGWHPEAVADLIEILGIAGRAQHILAELPRWMADEPRAVDPGMWGNGQASIRWQPKGVIGNMVPWNFPFDISFGPLLDMLAAGNRVIIKPSDLGPACGELMASMVAKAFDEDQVAVVTGGLDLAQAFPTRPFDHLMFTGSPAVGRSIMRAAAENLVPVTLELGGKSPAIVTDDAVNTTTVTNVVGMKLLKSGQVCVAPDHVFVPRDRVDEFVDLVNQHVTDNLPGHTASPDATGIISTRHLDRLLGMVEQARAGGYRVVQPEAGAVTDPTTRRTPFTLVVDPGPELDVMRQEIFGPILPVVPYDDLDEVVASVNAGERPLALYVYTQTPAVADRVLAATTSGGACVNFSVLHGALASLPFGGSGNSGMGRHHSIEGFREFSNPRGVFVRGTGDAVDTINPPYRTLEQMMAGAYAQIDGASR